MDNTSDLSRRLSNLRYSIDEAIVSLFEKNISNNVELSEAEQFCFDNTGEVVKRVMLDDYHSVVVISEDVDTKEDIEYGLMDLPTDEIMAVYEAMLRLSK